MRQLTSAILLGISSLAFAQSTSPEELLRSAKNLDSEAKSAQEMLDSNLATADSIMSMNDSIVYDSLLFAPVVVRDLSEILESLPDTMPQLPFNPIVGPWVFSGYRTQKDRSFNDINDSICIDIDKIKNTSWDKKLATPEWLYNALTQARISGDYMYKSMVYTPHTIQYTYWGLPVPPRLPEDDVTLGTYIKNLDLPEVAIADALLPEFEQKKKHWLHKFNTGLQFSQAYVSKNWYQGGNNYLQLLYNFYWNVQLNPTYHPNEIFESTVNYKLGINSVEQTDVHRKYSLSEDNFQYNVKYGFKAFKRWFYTVTGQFKTQFFRNYKTNTDIRTASFLSPADLNLGLGMTYSYANTKKTFNMTASIAPLSYNLKICIDDKIDHTQFNIQPDHKTHNEYGSSGEVNMTWQATSNISMRTRLFAFTDYNYFQGNVETTWDFAINRFLSTQIYVNMRYDSSSDFNISKWHHWMMKEILSFGLSYTFSTK
ncbi:MAG: DUF3078 domain-containing protein [Muribaculaceae bacterium]|nr:DUF3078 domain-containing protein [Muribaculaceae bacterium]